MQSFNEWYMNHYLKLPTEKRWDFDSEGRGYPKDCSFRMQLAWDAGVAAGIASERERVAIEGTRKLTWAPENY